MNKIIRKYISRINNWLLPKHDREATCDYIISSLNSNKPIMIARFGAVEIKGVLYGILPPPFCKILRKYCQKHLHTNAGFFPLDDSSIKKFAKIMMEDIKEVDILGSWRPEEIFFRKRLKRSYRCSIETLTPQVNCSKPWSMALANKKILIIHPFAKSIESQYKLRRDKLFENKNVLPKFQSLEVIEAVQTIANNTAGFKSWFEALEHMKQEIAQKDFDIALIGCGAYGFPLAAYIKRMGKKAVHIGGSLQLYFGIKGKRWDNSNLYNEYWISPSTEEKPRNLNKVEDGCYW